MQKLLKKIGKISFDHPWRIVSVWVIIILMLALGAGTFFKTPGNDMTIPGTEAQVGIERMGQLFPEAGKGSGRIIIAAPGGETIDSYKDSITVLVNDVSGVEGVKRVVNPFETPSSISKDRKSALIQVQMVNESGSIDNTTIESVQTKVDSIRQTGVTIETGGDLVNKFSHGPFGPGELVGVLVAFIVLIITFGSLAAAGMPLLIAIAAVVTTMAGLFSLSQIININTSTPAIAAMLGIAVGIDYALFIISRYRTYLLEGESHRDAAIRAVMTAGSAVVFAAATVLIALSALSVVQIPFITTMGLTAAVAVATAALMAVTVLPALFRLVGTKIISRKLRRKSLAADSQDQAEFSKKRVWYKWGSLLSKHPFIAIFAALIIIATVALPAQSLQMGMATDQYAAPETTERKAYDMVSKNFGVGYSAPLIIILEGLDPVSDAELNSFRESKVAEFEQEYAAQAEKMQAQFKQRLAGAATPAEQASILAEMQTLQGKAATEKSAALQKVNFQVDQYGKRLHLQVVATELSRLNDVETVLPAMISEDGRSGALQVIPSSGPSDQATIDLISALRDKNNQHGWSEKVTFTVTGSTAMLIDINKKLADALPIYLAVVVGLSLILLIIAFRSILIPIKATLGYLLSVGAMFGALVAAFQWGWFGITDAPAPIVSFVPLMALGILFGLAMDYEFFLVSSMREEYERTGDPHKAVVNGFNNGGKVVTAAAAIMVAVFAGFITNENNVVRALGFALAVGVFTDAFLVRMTIVPAVMSLVGKRAWWIPSWLSRILPRVSID